jgi:hypothetical protein
VGRFADFHHEPGKGRQPFLERKAMNIRKLVRRIIPNRLVAYYWNFHRNRNRSAPLKLFSKFEESYNVLSVAEFMAGVDSARFYERNLMECKIADDDFHLLEMALSWRKFDGLILEFGVASGRTLNHIADLAKPHEVYGFDWFQGLPEAWRPGFSAGSFAQEIPKVRNNAVLIRGLFEDTLPVFFTKHVELISFMHVDCDLFKSTKIILDQCGSRMAPGTVIVFDEYFNYPGWRQHEFRAFKQYISESGKHFEYLGFVPRHQQVCVRITG